ncbi:DUF883 domain-containing protein [Alteromonas pelagimontana]|uniref:DUF883 domain-containing protein n=1 Tax=Alteromonas pelagimontana TaxID=1858656 RepID=A0A6M4MI83_9ALTE|nr:DUF883 domain-containing protein [Alteromonas pelagimontana]QJR82310.1 DUF883 domain-containing protein [Alteromonas pelagimontana]
MAIQTPQGVTDNLASKKPSTANGVGEKSHPVTDKLQETLHSSVDKLASSASRAEETLRSSASGTSEKVAASKREAEQKWLGSSVRKYAVENPIAAASVAFAAGMLITSLMRKK